MNLRGHAEAKLAAWTKQRELRRTVLQLALPIVGSDLLQRGVNVVDALLVGRLGAAELAAVGLSQLLIMFIMALVYGLGVGSTVMVAFHTGAVDERRRAWAARTSLWIGVAATGILGGAGVLLAFRQDGILKIEDEDVELLPLELFKGLFSVGGDIGHVPLPGELRLQHAGKVLLVVGDQHPDLSLFRTHHLLSPTCALAGGK